MTDAISNVQARIAEIQQQIQAKNMAALQASKAQQAAATTAPAAGLASALGDASSSNSATSFQDLLETAQTQMGGQVDTTAVEAAIKKFGNGKIPESLLQSIGVGDHKMQPAAAESVRKMIADARSQGVHIGVNDSYRDFDEQVDTAKRKGLYGHGGLAAVPGTSNHGLGLSVDLQLDSKGQAWMARNGSRYGMVNDVRGEPWHWTYKK